MMTRAEHVQWAKDRALAELDAGHPTTAIASVASDLRQHPETEDHAAIQLMMMLAMNGHLETVSQVREFVNGIR